ncbi:MAG: hypothetical protein Q7U78_13400, partial [Gallionella sp.]|nr:hypothetical protein [Gallionella sp.]
LENAVRKFHKTDQDVIGFRGCEFIRTEHVDCANEFAPTRSSTAVFRLMYSAIPAVIIARLAGEDNVHGEPALLRTVRPD